jgi:DNA-binding PadR family transcriptional regulator
MQERLPVKLPLPTVQEDLLTVVATEGSISAADIYNNVNTARRRHGVPSLKVGSFYPTLHKIRDQGLIMLDNARNENKQRNKYYKITEMGRRAIAIMDDYRAELRSSMSQRPKP